MPVESTGTAESYSAKGTATAAPSPDTTRIRPARPRLRLSLSRRQPPRRRRRPVPSNRPVFRVSEPGCCRGNACAGAKSDDASPQPEAPTTVAAPPTDQQPAASTGEDAVPTTSAIAPPPAPAGEPTPAAAIPGEPAPAAVADLNAPITEQLRGLADGKFDRIIGGKKDRAAIRCLLFGAQLCAALDSPTARSTSAPRRRSPISARSTPTVSILPTIRFRNFASVTEPPALAAAEIGSRTSLITYAHHAAIGSRSLVARQRSTSPTIARRRCPAKFLARWPKPGRQGCERGTRRLRAAGAALSGAESQARANCGRARATAADRRIPMDRFSRSACRTRGAATARAVCAIAGGTARPTTRPSPRRSPKFQKEHDLKPTGTLTSATSRRAQWP